MSEQLIELFKKTNALLSGHFELSSGKHSDQYFQCALVLQYPNYAEEIAKQLAEKLRDKGITCVVGPALGGVTIAYELARQLGCRAIFAERKAGQMELRRGFKVYPDDKVLIVEDVVTTGGSILEVAKVIEANGVAVTGFAAIVDRSGGEVTFPYPFTSLVQMKPKIFSPTECPLCQKGDEAVKPGSKSRP